MEFFQSSAILIIYTEDRLNVKSNMIHSRKLLFSLLSAFLLLSISFSGFAFFPPAEKQQADSVPKLDSMNRSILQEYIAHDPITVNNDEELAAAANSGVGSANDPYIITGRNITGFPTDGIYIRGTTKHFRVENCRVSDCERGIVVDNVTSGTVSITNNICFNNTLFGIHILYSEFSNITVNLCTDNGGIENRGCGLYLYYSGSSTLTNNTCNYNEDGIELILSPSSIIADNICNANRDNGISLWLSGSSILVNNTCNNGFIGIDLYDSDSSALINNICINNSKGIDFRISGFSHLTKNTCNDNRRYGISIDTSGYSILSNNTCNNNNGSGIFLYDSGLSTVANNTCNNNDGYGISLFDSSSVTLINNICIDNSEGEIYIITGVTQDFTTPTTTREPNFIDNISDRLFLFLIVIVFLLTIVRIKKE
ncbi:MAG: NosD domain-containing protein [Candidatus Hermodarchaeota archaeon]